YALTSGLTTTNTYSITGLIPTVTTTSPVTSIAQTSAVGAGNISSDGGSLVIVSGLAWSTSANPTYDSANGPLTGNVGQTTNGPVLGVISGSMTGLTCNTDYHVRAFAKNSAGLSYGLDVIFTTSACNTLPTLDTPTVTSVTTTTATLGARVTSLGIPAAISARGVCYNTTGTPTLSNGAICVTATLAQTLTSYTKGVVGLTPGTRYFYAGYATNTTGTGYSADGTFVTIPPTPNGLWVGPSTCGTTYLNTSWNATDGATSYQLYREGILLYNGPLLSFQDLGLALSSTHPYQVFASNDSGTSSPSITVFGTVSDSCVCPEPTTQDVSFSCPPVSGIAAVSGDVTRRLNKIYPECTFPSPATVENTQWVSDNNCKYPILPVVTTPTDSSVKATSATLGATVVSLGEPASITARGVCYGTAHNPDLTNGATCGIEGGLNIGVFTMNIGDILTPTTTYYYRGYATNSNAGTGYSTEGTFTTIALPPAPTVAFDSYNIKNEITSNINFEEAIVLKWTSTNANSCAITSIPSPSVNLTNLNTSGTKKLFPNSTSDYTLICTGEGGSAMSTLRITVGKIKPIFKER
ncbi:MAG: hypothetical protein WCI91_02255, partial [Candidatus Nomurabacteria bacterium]